MNERLWTLPLRAVCTIALALAVAACAAGSATRGAAGETAAPWLRQAPPAQRAVFAPGVISLPDVYEYGSWFSKDGRECYFGVELGDRSEIRATQYRDGSWDEPRVLLAHPEYRFHDPCLSTDGSRLYFISNRPLDGTGPAKDSDLWFIERRDDGWSEPIRLPDTVNTPRDDYYMSFTDEGHLYFARNVGEDEQAGNYDLFRSRWSGGEFQEAEPLPGMVNTGAYECDVFVAPDESWLIVCSTRRSGLGRGDLYLSVRDAEGNWSAVRNLGPEVNTEGHELCPFVTSDGRWLVYTSQEDIVAIATARLGLP